MRYLAPTRWILTLFSILFATVGSARADMIVHIWESGGKTNFSWSGSVDSGYVDSTNGAALQSGLSSDGVYTVGPGWQTRLLIGGPPAGGQIWDGDPGVFSVMGSREGNGFENATGDPFGMFSKNVWLPAGYVAGSPISGGITVAADLSAFFPAGPVVLTTNTANEDFPEMPGDTITVNFSAPASAVPEPIGALGPLLLVAIGSSVARRRRRPAQ